MDGVLFNILLKVAIVLIVGFIGGQVAKALKLPNVSGYLVFGVLLGPSLGLIVPGFKGLINANDQDTLRFISEMALAFIAFSIGSEFNVANIKKQGKEITILTAFEVLGAVVLVFLLMLVVPKPQSFNEAHGIIGYEPFAKPNIAMSMVLASMSAATAPAATLMVIRQYRAYGPVTRAILPITALDDIFGIIVFGFFSSIAQILVPSSGVDMPLWLMISKPFIEVFGSMIIGAVIGIVLSYAARKFDRERDNIQVLAVASIVLTVGLFSLLNHDKVLGQYGISLSSLLSSIVTGAMIANLTRRPDRTFQSVNDFTTPFYIIFFTMAGASLDLGILKVEWMIAIVALVYIFARGFGKYIGTYIGARIARSNPNVRKWLGLGLLPQGGISIGLLVIVGATLPSMYPIISTIIMLSILVYETTGPIFAKISISKAGEINGLDKLQELSSVEDLVPQE
ncbi:MAG TPA: cation:proton antiporter [Acholeplasmataceae bacterium]|jgi:Kef-type K+ transport system membrane component KefB|nr:cation:proton antiporter [Acholeplasmataceae bacterium]